MDKPLKFCKLPKYDLMGRSGHRIVVDGKYMYCWGGYNPDSWDEDSDSPLFQELWRFNIWSKTWKLLPTYGDVPTELASHSILKIHDHILHFGGTGIPFGHTNTNTLYDLDLKTLQWRRLVKVDEDSETHDSPRPKYGQTMTWVGEYIYVVGGTCGFTYDCDVHRLSLQTLSWEELPPQRGYVPEGRYRHEVVHYDGKLYMFGGGTGASSHDLDKIDIFNIEKRSWQKVETRPYLHPASGQSEYPEGRRCHSCTRFRQTMYLCGGLSGDIKSVVWSFDLPSLQWTRLATHLVRPVYFHSADVSPDGCLIVFGGVTRIADQRTSDIQIMWVKIPELKLLCWKSVLDMLSLKEQNTQEEQTEQKQSLLDLGIPVQFVETIL